MKYLSKQPGRRKFIKSTVMTLGLSASLAMGLLGSANVNAAVGEPEKEELKFGFIKLTDMAPLAIAKEKGFFEVFTTFFKKKGMGMALAFILFFRLGESQLVKMAAPFFLDPVEKGGLGYTTAEVGTIYGTVGVIMLTLGGILGGILISRDGLKKWMLPMVLSINIPNAFYAFLAFTNTNNIVAVVITVVLEQFGYGFAIAGFEIFYLQGNGFCLC